MNIQAITIDRSLVQSEEQLLERWGQYDKPRVSINCITYNHAKYLRDALDGFLIQKIDFPFEILIHDDASTDDTANIIQEYENKYPRIIKPIYQTVNQYSQGKKPGIFNLKRAQGDFIAWCEGDDFWIDHLKLHKQVAFLSLNPNCSMVFHAVYQLDSQTEKSAILYRNDTKSRNFSMKELIMGGGGLIGTQSIVLRREVLDEIPKFFDTVPAGDYPLVLLAKCKGQVFYLDETMAVYRRNNPFSLMGKVEKASFEEKMSRYSRFAQMLRDFDIYTKNNFSTWTKRKGSDFVFKTFRRGRFDVPLRERAKQLKKYFHCLTGWHKLLALVLLLPIPLTKNELMQKSGGGLKSG